MTRLSVSVILDAEDARPPNCLRLGAEGEVGGAFGSSRLRLEMLFGKFSFFAPASGDPVAVKAGEAFGVANCSVGPLYRF